jgi:hypothetical protein
MVQKVIPPHGRRDHQIFDLPLLYNCAFLVTRFVQTIWHHFQSQTIQPDGRVMGREVLAGFMHGAGRLAA